MILDRVILDNFGAYAGRQEAVLTPEPGKPIILFGGLNGGGKTTFLDSIQLGFYGRKARTSNWGGHGYRSYLAECINRNANPEEGASITIQFHRMVDGHVSHFEQRAWKRGPKGIEMTLRVNRDGEPDELLTEHWDETMEAWLPAGISHLFFFDGEQIKDLADGHHAGRIIETAIHSLLGLDLVDRLQKDLTTFESKKREEPKNSKALLQLKHAEEELDHLLEAEASLLQEEGRAVNEAGRLAVKLQEARDAFEADGGNLFLRHEDLKGELSSLLAQQNAKRSELRNLASGPLPLLMLEEALAEVQTQAHHEKEIHHARVLRESLQTRDDHLLQMLRDESISNTVLTKIRRHLDKERREVGDLADESLPFDAESTFETELLHLREHILPTARDRARQLIGEVERLEERLIRLEAELARVPDEERIAAVQEALRGAQTNHETALHHLEELKVRKKALRAQCERAEQALKRVRHDEVDARFGEDARQRMVRHSRKVQKTLDEFKVRVIRKHAGKIERLMLESFQSLLRKSGLISGLTIDPRNYTVVLLDRSGNPLPFDRLSAGERQLLATSLLWGLARASGRPVPTIIDTPLGRLDSSHRRHLIERYFPHASHQVILLSTDEEIVGDYLKSIQPFVTRSYHLCHDEALGTTSVNPGYFPEYETAS